MKRTLNPVFRLSFPLASAFAAILCTPSVNAQTSFTSTAGTGAWNTARWNNVADGPTYTSAFTANNPVNFTSGTYSFATGIGSGSTINVGNVTLSDNVTVSFTGTVAGTYAAGGAVRTINVGSNSTFNMGGQAVSTAAGTGFIKSGEGTWVTSGGTYTGGFTLNAGTIAMNGVNAMGGGATQTLTINGGIIRSTNTGARDLSSKYGGGITIGGNFTLGDATATGALTFTNNMALGATSRTITANSGANLNGIISGGAGVGITKNGVGTLTLGGNNDYTGATIVDAGTLQITHANALGTAAGSTTINGGNGTGGVTLSLSGAASGLTIAENLNFFGSAAGRANLTNNSAQNHTLTGAIDVSSDTNLTQFTSASTGSITISGDITGTMSGGAVFFVRGVSTNSLNQVIGNVSLTGGNFAKTDGGTWLVGATGKTYNWANTLVAVGTLKMGRAGVLPSTAELIMGNSTGSSTGMLDINGFNQTLAGIVYNGGVLTTGTRTVTNSGSAAVLTVDNALDYSPTAGIVANSVIITGALSLIKNGGGKLTLSGANTYTGTTAINQGTLLINGSTSATSAFTVSNNAVLGGVGTIAGSITLNNTSTLSPGASPGILNTGSVTTTSGTTVAMEIDGLTAGTQYDRLNTTGTVTLDSSLLVTFGFSTPTFGDTFDIWLNDGVDPIGGIFSGLPEGSFIPAGSGSLSISYVANADGGAIGNDIRLTYVPEPGAPMLAGLGLLALLRRKRQQRN